MKILLTICVLCVAVVLIAGEHVPHSTVSYAIVPVKEITKEMMILCAQTSMDTLRKSTNGTMAVLKWIEWKKVSDPMPPKYPNDISLSATQLDYNEKMSKYLWAHKITPEIMRKYKQFTYAQIKEEMKKPEWNAKDGIDINDIEAEL